MKNKYIFLIIAVGLAAYFLVRPQIGISGADTQQAQVSGIMSSIKCLNNPAACILFGLSSNGQTININTTPQNAPSNTQSGSTPLMVTLDRSTQTLMLPFTDMYGNSGIARPVQCGRPPRRIPGYYYSCMGNGRYIRIPCGLNNLYC